MKTKKTTVKVQEYALDRWAFSCHPLHVPLKPVTEPTTCDLYCGPTNQTAALGNKIGFIGWSFDEFEAFPGFYFELPQY